MRLPFGLGRRSSSGDGASSDGSGAESGAAPVRPTAAPSRAWASLPPIQRTAGSMPLVAAPRTFASALPGSHPLPPIVQPLGHEVSSLATPGLVVARTRPVQGGGSGSIPAPVQRRARGGSRPAQADAAPFVVAEPQTVDHLAHDGHVDVAPPVAPIRTMPTVSRLAVRVPDRPLTSAASAALPAAVQRAAAAAVAEAASSGTPAPTPSGGMRRVPSSMPLAKPALSRQASVGTDLPAPSIPAAPTTVTRGGLGEPMTSLPASARPISAPGPVLSRSTTSGPMPIAAASLRSPVQRSAAGSGPASQRLALSPRATAVAAPATLPRLPQLPHLPVSRSASAAGSSGASPSPAPERAATPAASPEIRPIAGANPIRTSFAIQREAADDFEDESGDDAALPSPWWAPATEAQARPAAPGQLGADGPATSIQRIAARDAAPPMRSAFGGPSRPSALGAAPAGSRAPVQRVSAPGPRPSPPAMTLAREPGNRAAIAAPAEPAAPSISFPPRTLGGGAVVQTSPAPASASFAGASAGASGPVASVQRDGSVAVAAPTPVPPTGQSGPVNPSGGSGSAGTGSSSHSERDLDELAQALFGRIRGRIRSDLIYDREAKGLTFDNV